MSPDRLSAAIADIIGDLLGFGTHRKVPQNAGRAKPVGMTPTAGEATPCHRRRPEDSLASRTRRQVRVGSSWRGQVPADSESALGGSWIPFRQVWETHARREVAGVAVQGKHSVISRSVRTTTSWSVRSAGISRSGPLPLIRRRLFAESQSCVRLGRCAPPLCRPHVRPCLHRVLSPGLHERVQVDGAEAHKLPQGPARPGHRVGPARRACPGGSPGWPRRARSGSTQPRSTGAGGSSAGCAGPCATRPSARSSRPARRRRPPA